MLGLNGPFVCSLNELSVGPVWAQTGNFVGPLCALCNGPLLSSVSMWDDGAKEMGK